jgi:hypothetical protein
LNTEALLEIVSSMKCPLRSHTPDAFTVGRSYDERVAEHVVAAVIK